MIKYKIFHIFFAGRSAGFMAKIYRSLFIVSVIERVKECRWLVLVVVIIYEIVIKQLMNSWTFLLFFTIVRSTNHRVRAPSETGKKLGGFDVLLPSLCAHSFSITQGEWCGAYLCKPLNVSLLSWLVTKVEHYFLLASFFFCHSYHSLVFGISEEELANRWVVTGMNADA